MGSSGSKVSPEEEQVLRKRLKRRSVVLIIPSIFTHSRVFTLLIQLFCSMIDRLTILTWSNIDNRYRHYDQLSDFDPEEILGFCDKIVFADRGNILAHDGNFSNALGELPLKEYGRIVECSLTQESIKPVRPTIINELLVGCSMTVQYRFDYWDEFVLVNRSEAELGMLLALELPLEESQAQEECLKAIFN